MSEGYSSLRAQWEQRMMESEAQGGDAKKKKTSSTTVPPWRRSAQAAAAEAKETEADGAGSLAAGTETAPSWTRPSLKVHHAAETVEKYVASPSSTDDYGQVEIVEEPSLSVSAAKSMFGDSSGAPSSRPTWLSGGEISGSPPSASRGSGVPEESASGGGDVDAANDASIAPDSATADWLQLEDQDEDVVKQEVKELADESPPTQQRGWGSNLMRWLDKRKSESGSSSDGSDKGSNQSGGKAAMEAGDQRYAQATAGVAVAGAGIAAATAATTSSPEPAPIEFSSKPMLSPVEPEEEHSDAEDFGDYATGGYTYDTTEDFSEEEVEYGEQVGEASSSVPSTREKYDEDMDGADSYAERSNESMEAKLSGLGAADDDGYYRDQDDHTDHDYDTDHNHDSYYWDLGDDTIDQVHVEKESHGEGEIEDDKNVATDGIKEGEVNVIDGVSPDLANEPEVDSPNYISAEDLEAKSVSSDDTSSEGDDNTALKVAAIGLAAAAVAGGTAAGVVAATRASDDVPPPPDVSTDQHGESPEMGVYPAATNVTDDVSDDDIGEETIEKDPVAAAELDEGQSLDEDEGEDEAEAETGDNYIDEEIIEKDPVAAAEIDEAKSVSSDDASSEDDTALKAAAIGLAAAAVAGGTAAGIVAATRASDDVSPSGEIIEKETVAATEAEDNEGTTYSLPSTNGDDDIAGDKPYDYEDVDSDHSNKQEEVDDFSEGELSHPDGEDQSLDTESIRDDLSEEMEPVEAAAVSAGDGSDQDSQGEEFLEEEDDDSSGYGRKVMAGAGAVALAAAATAAGIAAVDANANPSPDEAPTSTGHDEDTHSTWDESNLNAPEPPVESSEGQIARSYSEEKEEEGYDEYGDYYNDDAEDYNDGNVDAMGMAAPIDSSNPPELQSDDNYDDYGPDDDEYYQDQTGEDISQDQDVSEYGDEDEDQDNKAAYAAAGGVLAAAALGGGIAAAATAGSGDSPAEKEPGDYGPRARSSSLRLKKSVADDYGPDDDEYYQDQTGEDGYLADSAHDQDISDDDEEEDQDNKAAYAATGGVLAAAALGGGIVAAATAGSGDSPSDKEPGDYGPALRSPSIRLKKSVVDEQRPRERQNMDNMDAIVEAESFPDAKSDVELGYDDNYFEPDDEYLPDDSMPTNVSARASSKSVRWDKDTDRDRPSSMKKWCILATIIIALVGIALGLTFGLTKRSSSGSDTVVFDQVGETIDGPSRTFEYGPGTDGEFGASVSLSGDGTRVAIGAPNYSASIFNQGERLGLVQVFEQQNGAWTKLEPDIFGDLPGDATGTSVSLSSDGMTLAVGSPEHLDTIFGGQVIIYQYFYGRFWQQLGSPIIGDDAFDRLGSSVSLNDRGDRVAISQPTEKPDSASRKVAKIYELRDDDWVQLGDDLVGRFGSDPVSMSGDGKVVALGSFSRVENDYRASVLIYHNANENSITETVVDWKLKGPEIEVKGTRGSYDTLWMPSLSADGNIVAIGSAVKKIDKTENPNERYELQVLAYRYDEEIGDWIELPVHTNLERKGSHLVQFSTSLSGDGRVLVVGDSGAGIVEVLHLSDEEGAYIPVKGNVELKGVEGSDDLFGYGVAVSSDGKQLASGAPQAVVAGERVGSVSVFEM